MHSAVLEGKGDSGSWDVWVCDAVVDKELITNKRVEKREKTFHYFRELRS